MEAKDLTKPILILEINYHITTPNDEDTTNYRKGLETLIKESSDKTITCYTDGSRTNSENRADYFPTYYTNTYDIFDKHSLLALLHMLSRQKGF